MGMPNIVFRLQLFRGDFDQVWSQMKMLTLMEALCSVNQLCLQQAEAFKKRGLVKVGYPSLYRSGLHYETEKGTEIWPDIPSLLAGTMGRGKYPGPWGDCEDLASYRAAELRELPFHYERPAPWDKKKTEVADPRYPQSKNYSPADARAIQVPLSGPAAAEASWAGWRRVAGGIKARAFAKWRRGPTGSYHYHALVLLPDGRLEDPSLALGMGREAQFAADGTAEKLKQGAPVVIQYAKPPEVIAVDPEKPSGYAGGIASKLDERVLTKARLDGIDGDDLEVGAYLSNEVQVAGPELDLDAVIGWSREHKEFVTRGESDELARMLGYSEED